MRGVGGVRVGEGVGGGDAWDSLVTALTAIIASPADCRRAHLFGWTRCCCGCGALGCGSGAGAAR